MVDNFQGEEADVIIVNLVRGGKPGDIKCGTIGFLQTSNHINVLLSLARKGMYLLGQAPLLHAKSEMWNKVLSILESHGQVGKAFPLHCQKHPEYIHRITEPAEISIIFPDGGCLSQCGMKLRKCGHTCPVSLI